MAKAKKNVFQEFMQDDYIPESSQYIVKYVAGKGNNLHLVEDYESCQYLVSMPKKFRQTVWLKKNDCIVIDPIAEGKKVRGEIICVIPLKNVLNLIQSGEWTPAPNNTSKDALLEFFKKHLETLSKDNSSDFIPSDNESDDTDDSSDEEEEDSELEEEDAINSGVEETVNVSEDCTVKEISK